jgi:uncharacterized protein (DUF305 family)
MPSARTLILAVFAACSLPLVARSADPAKQAFEEANMKMHKAMSMEYAGDPDIQFIKSMIPHHQGAIDMAEIELKYGKDPQAREMAEKIISAQKGEIAEMKKWLKAHGQ